MIRLAEQRCLREHATNTRFLVGDMMALPLPERSIDAVTIGYGLRNCPRLAGALAEIYRVLKPGGYVASLEFTRPTNTLWRWLFLQYLLAAGNFFGWLWHREPAVYGYLARSIAQFHSQGELARAMNDAGFEVRAEHPWLFGAVCVHLARKRP
jgi:demethylmenaquinone methyltransferase/2-methoxy-6-polyprenyl-1,4-benzoquinol methylase